MGGIVVPGGGVKFPDGGGTNVPPGGGVKLPDGGGGGGCVGGGGATVDPVCAYTDDGTLNRAAKSLNVCGTSR